MSKALISPREAAEIAKLARLELGPAACEDLARELGAVLEHMAVLDELDTDDVEATTHVASVELRLRPDDVGESLDQDLALRDAPQSEGGFFVVPAAIESR